MTRFLLLPTAVTLALTCAAATPVRAGGGDVAAGVIGGLAAGTIPGFSLIAADGAYDLLRIRLQLRSVWLLSLGI